MLVLLALAGALASGCQNQGQIIADRERESFYRAPHNISWDPLQPSQYGNTLWMGNVFP
jgi:hypothetical protein